MCFKVSFICLSRDLTVEKCLLKACLVFVKMSIPDGKLVPTLTTFLEIPRITKYEKDYCFLYNLILNEIRLSIPPCPETQIP